MDRTSGRNAWARPLADSIRAATLVWTVHPAGTLLVIFLTVVHGALPAIGLWISKLLIDGIVATIQGGALGPPVRLLWLAVLLTSVGLCGHILDILQHSATGVLGDLLRSEISLRVLRKANSLELPFFENDDFYDQLQNAYGEASERPLQIISSLLTILQGSITLSSSLFLLWHLYWPIVPVLITSSIPALLVQQRFGERNYWMLRHRTPNLRKQHYYGTLLTSDSFIKEIRICHLEDYFLGRYQSLFSQFCLENWSLVVRRSITGILATIVSSIGGLLAISYVVLQTLSSRITIGGFSLYTQAIGMMLSQIQMLIDVVSSLYSSSLFVGNLFEFLALPTHDMDLGAVCDEPIQEIEFCHVTFRYPGATEPTLNDINFKISRGQSMALVGRNGAGKTTIVKLLCRLYEPTSGEIRINGKNIRQYSSRSLQEQLTVLFQDYGRYYLTAQENVGVGRVALLNDIARIKSAAVMSGAHSTIEGLPHQYETMLGQWFDDGVQVSGGEWQKIALARAFFRDTRLLVLDEPTASLDVEAEAALFDFLFDQRGDRIMVLISHRFSTVRRADHILVLDDGRCLEEGSHEELMQTSGEYRRLYQLQAQGYSEIADSRSVPTGGTR